MKRGLAIILGAGAAVLGGCAHAPKVDRADSLKASDGDVVFYTLPRAVPMVQWKGVKKVFVAGPFTAELEALEKLRETNPGARCIPDSHLDPEDLCYWSLESKRPDASLALAACSLTKGADAASAQRAAYLFTDAPLELTTKSEADPNEHYAVRLTPGLFERLKTQMTLTPQGALTEFSAQSTNMAAQVGSALITRGVGLALGGVAGDEDPDSEDGSDEDATGLDRLVRALAQVEAKKTAALEYPDAAAAIALLSAEQAFLRRLAEGEVVEKPIQREYEVRADAFPRPGVTPEANEIPGQPRVVDVASLMGCARIPNGDQGERAPKLELDLDVVAISASYKSAREAARPIGKDPGLRYRIPVAALGQAALRCIDMEGRCKPPVAEAGKEPPRHVGVAMTVNGTAFIPQWGPTLALPRRLGWGSGSMTAKLDPQLGSLTFVATENTDSLAATVVNNLYQDATKDKDLAALQYEQQTLDLQVKICASRLTLGIPPGPECTTD